MNRAVSELSPGQFRVLRSVMGETRSRPYQSGLQRHLLLVTALGSVIVIALSVAFAAFSGGGAIAGQPAPNPVAGPPSPTQTHYLFRVVQQIAVDADGQEIPDDSYAMTMRDYVAPNGAVVSFRTGQQRGCFRFSGPIRPSLANPTVQYLAALPTDPDALEHFVRIHARGSSTRDEAIFDDVSYALRQMGWFATTRLRAAMLAVLRHLPEVAVHNDMHDYLGRSALRVDFVDQRIFPGHVHALYFDPATFEFLEDRSSPNGAPAHYAGPTPAYGDPAPSNGLDPEQLSDPSFLDVVTNQSVTDTVPACHR